MLFSNFTEKARIAISEAHDAAAEMGHNYIGSEHLLMGLIREGSGVAAKVIEKNGVTAEKVKDTVTPGSHGSTFGGNPVCAAGAISIVSRIDDKFLKSVREKSEYIKNFLMNIKGVKSVSGMGLMLGVETQKDAKQIASECLENGLLVLTAKTKIRLLPALNISYLELDRGLKILKEVIEK